MKDRLDFTEPRFTNPDAAREYLESVRWPNGAVCPHCGATERNSRIQAKKPGKGARPGLWFCGDCREQFTVTVGTVFERSKIPLHKWVLATQLMCSSKKGISSHQIHRMLGVTYQTAWFMTHRIREAFKKPGGMLGGGGKVVEADETFYGKIKGREPRWGRKGKGGIDHKHKILALVERDGETRAFHVPSVDFKTLKPLLLGHIAQDTHLMTDGASHYRTLKGGFLSHEIVNHTRGEYARKSRKVKGLVAHTNTVESFFGILKRGLFGTYHHVSEEHLQRYITEFGFRYGHRTSLGYTDLERAEIALKRIGGKRLTYRRTDRSDEAAIN